MTKDTNEAIALLHERAEKAREAIKAIEANAAGEGRHITEAERQQIIELWRIVVLDLVPTAMGAVAKQAKKDPEFRSKRGVRKLLEAPKPKERKPVDVSHLCTWGDWPEK
jgi:hypothetical protein